MRKIATIVAVLSISCAGFAQTGAKIEFKAKDNTIDYGTITKGKDNGVRTFEFNNSGDAPLIITAVQSTASCTILKQPKDPIPPGAVGKIEIKYNMVLGPIRKTITVESNAVNFDGGRIPLKIRGEVIAN
jgi:hypothetical protein